MTQPVTRFAQDTCDGVCPANSTELPSSSSPDVYVNSNLVIRQTDTYEGHKVGDPHIGRKVSTGSSTVFANGLQLARQGDPIDCGAKILTGSGDVFAGG